MCWDAGAAVARRRVRKNTLLLPRADVLLTGCLLSLKRGGGERERERERESARARPRDRERELMKGSCIVETESNARAVTDRGFRLEYCGHADTRLTRTHVPPQKQPNPQYPNPHARATTDAG